MKLSAQTQNFRQIAVDDDGAEMAKASNTGWRRSDQSLPFELNEPLHQASTLPRAERRTDINKMHAAPALKRPTAD